MNHRNAMTRLLEVGLIVFILGAGFVLRLSELRQIPPTLSQIEESALEDTSDVVSRGPLLLVSADDGTIRGTLFAYAAGLPIKVMGDPLSGRYLAAFAGIVLLLEVYIWVRLATQNHPLALATMAGLAVSFWGMMVSRAATSASLFPVFFMGAALAMRSGFMLEEDIEDELIPLKYRPSAVIEGWWWFVLAGIMLGASLYTYPPARLMWFVFPVYFVLLSMEQPGVTRRIWPGLALMLAVALLIAIPLIRVLAAYPDALYISNIFDMIAGLVEGNPISLRRSLRAAFGLFTIRGDPLYAVNVPGKPLLGPMMSLLFYIGVSVALVSYVYPYRPAHRGVRSLDESFRVTSTNIFMVLVLAFGLLPVVVMGVEGSMLSAVGMLPALYYFPALAIQWMADRARQHAGPDGPKALWVAYSVGLMIITGMTAHTYFTVWAQ